VVQSLTLCPVFRFHFNLQPIYKAWERETIQKGIEQGIEQAFSLTIPVLVDAGLRPQQIAQRLQIDLATVDRLLNQVQSQN
jgi:predicted transposase YdaD